MAEFLYARGRIAETLQFVSQEMAEFAQEYAGKTWTDYQQDKKLQKLMDRTVENILTAFIELCGTVLAQEGTGAESYADALKKCAQLFGLSEEEQKGLAMLAPARNQLAHRYLNFKWQAINTYSAQCPLIQKMLAAILKREQAQSV